MASQIFQDYQAPQNSQQIDETLLQFENKEVIQDISSQREDASSENLPLSKDDINYESILFSHWWSIYTPLHLFLRFVPKQLLSRESSLFSRLIFPLLFLIVLIVVAPPIVYPIISLIRILSERDDQASIFEIYLNSYFIGICIFINFVTFTKVFDIQTILGLLHKNKPETMTISISENVKPISYWFQHICFSWPFTLVFSGLYTFVVPVIHPDYTPRGTEWLYPIIWPIFIINIIYGFYFQLFWVICYSIQQEYRFHDLSLTQDESYISKLESMKYFCKSQNIIVKGINDRLGCFITSSIILAFCGLLFPINQYRHLSKNNQLDTNHHIAIMIWIILSLFQLLYSLFRAIKIPLIYNDTVKFYSINVGAAIDGRTKEFNDKYEIVKKELFSQSPKLIFAGLTPINLSFLALVFLIQVLNLIWQWSDLVPYQSLRNETLIQQYQ